MLYRVVQFCSWDEEDIVVSLSGDLECCRRLLFSISRGESLPVASPYVETWIEDETGKVIRRYRPYRF